MTRFTPGSVRTTLRSAIRHYHGLQLAERVVFLTWSTALLVTLLGFVGVTTYQATWTAQTQSELCSVSSVSPQYSTVAGHHYRFVDTSCGKLEIHPGDSVTRALEPVTLDPIALTGSPSSEGNYVFTFQGWGSGHKLISVQPR
jgi:hypothetical protein